jgi:hypothetical protein
MVISVQVILNIPELGRILYFVRVLGDFALLPPYISRTFPFPVPLPIWHVVFIPFQYSEGFAASDTERITCRYREFNSLEEESSVISCIVDIPQTKGHVPHNCGLVRKDVS